MPFETPARADECGDLKVPGYTATRLFGPLRLKVTVSPEAERIESADGHVEIKKDGKHYIINYVSKEVGIIPDSGPADLENVKKGSMYADRVPVGDLTQVTIGFKTPEGNKEWLSAVRCRPDGIFVEERIRTPKGTMITKQVDIKPGPVPADAFEVPSDYKRVDVPPPPQ